MLGDWAILLVDKIPKDLIPLIAVQGEYHAAGHSPFQVNDCYDLVVPVMNKYEYSFKSQTTYA